MSRNPVNKLDVEAVERCFAKYPKLQTFICAGTISLKATRDILNIDRYECYKEVYLPMMEAGAIYGSSSNMYRASPELREYMQLREVTAD